MYYQYYCGYCGRETKLDQKTDICACFNCGRIARFDGIAPKKQQNLKQSYCSMVITESKDNYKNGK